MKRFLLFFVSVFLLAVSCSKKLEIESNYPSQMIGEWSTSNLPAVDTSLVLGDGGNYFFVVRTGSDSLGYDTSYYASGSWLVEFIDLNNDNIYGTDEDARFFTEIKKSSVKSDEGVSGECKFNVSDKYLELFSESGKTFISLERVKK